jgi:hypothetical protein
MNQVTEQREIIIYATLQVAGRDMQVPITISVGLDDLLEIVVQHLNDGTDLRQLLVAHYAQQVSQDLQVAPPAEEGRPERRRSGQASTFSDAELDAVNLDAPPPPYRGKGPKTKSRLRWEAAMARAGRAVP